ncbi:MAG: glycosyl transferase family 1 [Rhodospirillales bacterium 70-18]|nr:MAG: glycosyl transferase family 1 [Rhodospirillales bacterium 70-18]
MNLLFLHQNMPGQFKHLAPALARDPANKVVFVTRRDGFDMPGVRRVTYQTTRTAQAATHHYVRLYENCVLHGQAVVRACQELAREGFRPDVVVAHPGWGEALFVRDVFPRAAILNYCEFYYHGEGADVGFDPETPADLDAVCRARARNAHLLLSLESCDHGLSPTQWQRDQHPAPLRGKISVIFDGIDTGIVRPDPAARFTLPDGGVLTAADEVVTYVARNLEPYRGFPSFMRAVPAILRARPAARVVIVGGDAVSYGQSAPDGQSWRARMLAEVGPLDPARVHMLPPLRYHDYLSLLRVSTAHVYLTVPFVLSWSCMEALAAGCLLVGSDTPPVREVVEHGRNGLLADFLNPADIAGRVAEALANRAAMAPLRARARETVLSRYDLAHCLPAQMRLVASLA